MISDRANDPVGLQALGAYVQSFGCSINASANTLNIWIPAAIGAHVRVRHALAEAGSFTAHVTNGSHDDLLGFQFGSFHIMWNIFSLHELQATMTD